jgi:hypothetical protein
VILELAMRFSVADSVPPMGCVVSENQPPRTLQVCLSVALEHGIPDGRPV